ncbi:Hint domain-containing protein [Rhodobacteraceae bacterium D3-12]|nr:Hint domain-containing protein [Rhodobacteraceae bacterium D3-12]
MSYSDHVAPASIAFESAFAAFARGTMISTVNGPCAVEDLAPGALLETQEGIAQPILWIGRMMLVPTAPVHTPAQLKLTRIMADSFGLARPMPDLLLGHASRLARSPAELREYALQTTVLTPPHAFIDGVNVIEITPSPIALYHIGLGRHAILNAAGLDVESFHPGLTLLREMGHNARALFLSLFPHIKSEDGFGSLCQPRAGAGTLDQLSLP